MPTPEPPSGSTDRHDDADELVEFDLEPFELADPAPTPTGVTSCPKCGLLQRADAAICTRCAAAVSGATSDAARKAAIDASRPCRNCGYEMRGLPHARCPECGTGNPVGRRRDIVLDAEADARRQMRLALTIGGACAGVCLLLTLVGGGWRGPIGFVVFTALELPIIVGATFLLGQFAIDIDDPWPLTTARLFAVQMIGSIAFVALAIVCLPSAVLSALVVMVALSYLLDLEPTEAFILGATLMGVRVMLSLMLLFGV